MLYLNQQQQQIAVDAQFNQMDNKDLMSQYNLKYIFFSTFLKILFHCSNEAVTTFKLPHCDSVTFTYLVSLNLFLCCILSLQISHGA